MDRSAVACDAASGARARRHPERSQRPAARRRMPRGSGGHRHATITDARAGPAMLRGARGGLARASPGRATAPGTTGAAMAIRRSTWRQRDRGAHASATARDEHLAARPYGEVSSLLGHESVVREIVDSIFADSHAILPGGTAREMRIVVQRSPAVGLQRSPAR